MQKVSFNVGHSARMRGLSQSRSSLNCSTRSTIPKTNSRSRGSPDPPEAKIQKRVKFAGSTNICEPEMRHDELLLQNEGVHLSCVDGAKTSEFKSFKSLLEKTVHKHSFDKVAKSAINLKKGKARDCMQASSNAILSKSDISRSSLPVENVSSIALFSSPSQISQKLDFKNKANVRNGTARSLPHTKVTPVDRLFHPSSQIAGENCGGHSAPMQEHKGTFSGKRAYLLQLAAGTRLQNMDDFLSNRSDFTVEILERLGIGRNSNRHDKIQKPEQKDSAHRIPASSKRSDHFVEFCDNSQENSCSFKRDQDDNHLTLTWDDNETQLQPWNYERKEFDLDNPASAMELIKEFDCKKYSYYNKAPALLNSSCNIAEVKVFPADSASYIEQPFKNLHFPSELDSKDLYDLCVTKDSTPNWNFKPELDCSNHGFHKCILSNGYNFERCFKEQAVPYMNEFSKGLYIHSPGLHLDLAKEQSTFPLLLSDATAEQELDFASEIRSSNFFDVLQNQHLDPTLTAIPGFLLSTENNDSRMIKEGGEVGWFLKGDMENAYEDDIDFMGAPNNFPVGIFSFTELPSLDIEYLLGIKKTSHF